MPQLEEQIRTHLEQVAPGYDLVIEDMPKLADLFPKLAKDTQEESDDEPFPVVRRPMESTAVILHSSGSTGMPKPIRQTFHYTVSLAASNGKNWYMYLSWRGKTANDGRCQVAGTVVHSKVSRMSKQLAFSHRRSTRLATISLCAPSVSLLQPQSLTLRAICTADCTHL